MSMFIQNFLSEFVKDQSFLTYMSKRWGVPQGSILSVTLFILKINSIADLIPSSFEKSLFVDDFSIICSSRNMASIKRQLQFSKTKTVCMHFCNKRKFHPDPTLAMYNSHIPVVSQMNSLVLYLTIS